MLVQRGYPEEVSLGLPEPEFWEDGFSFVITFRSIAPREGVAPTLTPSGRCWNRG